MFSRCMYEKIVSISIPYIRLIIYGKYPLKSRRTHARQNSIDKFLYRLIDYIMLVYRLISILKHLPLV